MSKPFLSKAISGAFAVMIALAANFTAATAAKASDPEGVVRGYISSQLYRLNLGSEQKAKFKRLLSITSAKRRKIFRDLGIKIGKSAGYMNLLKARSRILSIAPAARARAAKVLNPKQLKIYDQIRVEVGKVLQSKLKA